MMLLLDTNVLLRFLFAPRKLSRTAVHRIERAAIVYVSSISVLEIAIKASKNKLAIDSERLGSGIIEAGLTPLLLSLPHALRVRDIAPAHPDPFDRALLAQAIAEPVYLLTTNAALANYSQLVIVV